MWWLGKSEVVDAQAKSLACSIFFFLGINWENPQMQSACLSAGQPGINELVCFRLLTDLFKPKFQLQKQKFLLVNSDSGQWQRNFRFSYVRKKPASNTRFGKLSFRTERFTFFPFFFFSMNIACWTQLVFLCRINEYGFISDHFLSKTMYWIKISDRVVWVIL